MARASAVLGRRRHKRLAGLPPTLSTMSDEIRGNHTVWGLKRKRAEIAGIIADQERKLKHWKAALLNVDAVLRLMDSELDPTQIPAKRVHRRTKYLPGPDLARCALDELRKADGTPIDTKAIVEAAMATHSVPDNLQVRLSLMARLGRWLNERAEAGEIVRHGPAHAALWALPESGEQDSP